MEPRAEAKDQSTGAHPKGAALFVILASLAFSTSGPLARLARPIPPLTVAFARVAIAGSLLLLLDLPSAARSIAAMTARQRATVFGAGAILAVHFALFLAGLDRTSLPAAISLISLEPAAVVICAWALFGLRPSRIEQIGLVMATGGALLISSTAGVGSHRLDGDLMVVGAVVLYGLYVCVARALRDALPGRTYAALVYVAAALTLGVALPFTPGALDVLGSASPPPSRAILAVLGLAFIPTIIGHTAVQLAARRLSPSIVALVPAGETVGGIALSAALLGAIPTSIEIMGALIILAGTTTAIVGADRSASTARSKTSDEGSEIARAEPR